MKPVVIVGGALFIVAALVTLFSDHDWQAFLFLLAIGIALLIFSFRGR
jgi:hypothetical protein